MPDHYRPSKQGEKSLAERNAGKFSNVMYRTQRSNAAKQDPGVEKSAEQKRLEDQQRAEEFEIHIENLRHEAIKQFDKELYDECIGTFQYLCELDPNNQTLRDYRELCEKLTGGTVPHLPEQISSAGHPFQAIGSLNGLGTADKFAKDPSPEKTAIKVNDKRSCELNAGHRPGGFEDSPLAELSDKSEILEIPDFDTEPPSGGHTGEKVTRPMVPGAFRELVLRFRPRSFKLVLSIAGILVLAAILGLPSWFHRWQEFQTPTPMQPIGRRDSQPPQESHISPSQTEPSTTLPGKAEKSNATERYVSPSDNIAVSHSSQVLDVEPQSKRPPASKTNSPLDTAAQAREMARNGNTVEAREVFSSLLERSRHEDSFPLSPEALEAEIKKLDLESYPVIHDHFLGSCRGLLEFNSYWIAFEPTGEGRHRFRTSLKETQLGEPGGKLRIFVGQRVYRFESGAGTSNVDRRQRLRAIYRAITSRSKGNPE